MNKRDRYMIGTPAMFAKECAKQERRLKRKKRRPPEVNAIVIISSLAIAIQVLAKAIEHGFG